jgi:hypothetical protein
MISNWIYILKILKLTILRMLLWKSPITINKIKICKKLKISKKDKEKKQIQEINLKEVIKKKMSRWMMKVQKNEETAKIEKRVVASNWKRSRRKIKYQLQLSSESLVKNISRRNRKIQKSHLTIKKSALINQE